MIKLKKEKKSLWKKIKFDCWNNWTIKDPVLNFLNIGFYEDFGCYCFYIEIFNIIFDVELEK